MALLFIFQKDTQREMDMLIEEKTISIMFHPDPPPSIGNAMYKFAEFNKVFEESIFNQLKGVICLRDKKNENKSVANAESYKVTEKYEFERPVDLEIVKQFCLYGDSDIRNNEIEKYFPIGQKEFICNAVERYLNEPDYMKQNQYRFSVELDSNAIVDSNICSESLIGYDYPNPFIETKPNPNTRPTTLASLYNVAASYIEKTLNNFSFFKSKTTSQHHENELVTRTKALKKDVTESTIETPAIKPR